MTLISVSQFAALRKKISLAEKRTYHDTGRDKVIPKQAVVHSLSQQLFKDCISALKICVPITLYQWVWLL